MKMIMKKKRVLFIFIGIIICGVIGVKAATTIQSSQVIYKDDKTLDTALNEMYDELYVGKEKLATAITNKGVTTTSESTFEEMANNVNSISSGNPSLRYNEETGYVEAQDDSGDWISIYRTDQLPLSSVTWIFKNGKWLIGTASVNYTNWGGSGSGTGTGGIKDSEIYVNVSGYGGKYYSTNVDLTDYKTAVFVGCYYTKKGNNVTYNTAVFVGTNKVSATYFEEVTSTTPSTYTIDISSVTGTKYVGMVAGSASTTSELYCSGIYLIK